MQVFKTWGKEYHSLKRSCRLSVQGDEMFLSRTHREVGGTSPSALKGEDNLEGGAAQEVQRPDRFLALPPASRCLALRAPATTYYLGPKEL